MNKKELIAKLAEKMTTEEVKVTKKTAEEYLEAFVVVVSEALEAGETVKIPGLGTFSVTEVAERRGTIQMGERKGEEYVTPAHKAPKFKIAKALKDLVK